MYMKVRIDGTEHEGTAVEILDHLRMTAFDPTEYPDAGSYLRQLRENFIRATDLECVLPPSGLERQARAMFAQLARAGAMEVIDDG